MMKFAFDMRKFLRRVPKDFFIQDDLRQVWRSSASIAANYLEAVEAMSKKDFLYRIRISRKEAKESLFWLTLLKNDLTAYVTELNSLIEECEEIAKILTAIAKTTQQRYGIK